MKNIFKYFGVAAAVVALAACNNVEYETTPYVAFGISSATYNEDAGTISIPVASHNVEGSTTVTFAIVDGTAVSGKNIEFASSPSLTFNGNESKNLELNIINLEGIFTGNLACAVNISGTTENVEVSPFNKVSLTIKDLDHPLTELFGDYTMKAVTLGSSGSYVIYSFPISLSQYEGDVNKIAISNLCPFFYAYKSYIGSKSTSVYGIVSEDKMTITVPLPQVAEATTDQLFSGVTANDPFTYYLWDGTNDTGTYNTSDGEIVFTKDEEGRFIADKPFAIGGKTDTVSGDGLFYYYMNCFATFNVSNYPTYFVKN